MDRKQESGAVVVLPEPVGRRRQVEGGRHFPVLFPGRRHQGRFLGCREDPVDRAGDEDQPSR